MRLIQQATGIRLFNVVLTSSTSGSSYGAEASLQKVSLPFWLLLKKTEKSLYHGAEVSLKKKSEVT